MSASYESIQFTRSSVAKILNCSPLTISNREKRGIYPQPTRKSSNNYRYYSLFDIFNLQELTYGSIYYGPILSELWDKGYKNVVECDFLLNAATKDYLNK